MSDRERILGRVRRSGGAVGLARAERLRPSAFRSAMPEPTWTAFVARLEEAAGVAVGPVAPSELTRVVAEQVAELGGGRCLAEPRALERLGDGPWEPAIEPRSPTDFHDVDVALAHAAFGVAENGALVLDAQTARWRALVYLCQHLILIVDAQTLVADVHAALRQIGPDGARQGCVTWIAGPSKTADIEQALVVGAHGPRSLRVVGVGPGSSTLGA